MKPTKLDPAAPLVLDTRELGRGAGSLKELAFIAPAPAGLGVEMLTVPVDSDLDLELKLETVGDGVLVTGDVEIELVGECARCLAELDSVTEVKFQELFLYQPGADDPEDVLLISDDLIDLEPVIRNSIVLNLPLQPLCKPGCLGLCQTCGAELNNDPNHTHEAPIDPRWAKLSELSD